MSVQSIFTTAVTAFHILTAFGGVILCTVCFGEGLLHFLDRAFSNQDARN